MDPRGRVRGGVRGAAGVACRGAGDRQLRQRQRPRRGRAGRRRAGGARDGAPPRHQSVVANSSPTARAASGFPTSASGAYEIVVSRAGFADATRTLTVTVARRSSCRWRCSSPGSIRPCRWRRPCRSSRRPAASSPAPCSVRRSRPCRSTAATSSIWRCSCPAWRRRTSAAISSSPRRRPCRASASRSSSQRNFSNNFIVDGLSANDDAAGLSSIPVGVDAVEQLQVVTSGGQAELGRALGGFVNVITRSGTNVFHGDVYGFFRDRALNAPNALTGTRLPMTQTQAGGSLGGPHPPRPHVLLRQRRAPRSRSGRSHHDRDANVDAINARLRAVAYPGLAGDDRPLRQPGRDRRSCS